MFARFSRFSECQRILLVQSGTVRDIIRMLPIINILRIRFPRAKIAWFATSEMIDFLNSYNIADRIILAKSGWHKKIYEIKTLRKRLLAFAPDLCLDFQGDVASGLAARLSGSRKQLAINGVTGRIFKKSKNLRQSEHFLEKRLQLLEMLNVAGASIDYDLPEIPGERLTADWIVHELALDSTPFAMLGVGVQSNSTYWEINRYVQVAEHLSLTLHLPTVVTWQSERERRMAEKIVAEAGGMVASAPALSMMQFAALSRRASVYIGADNDFLHVAAAVGTPCIGVFGDENSHRDAPCCDNFQWVQAHVGESLRTGRGNHAGTTPVRIDNYTYDVIRVCNACDEILRPEPVRESLPERQPVTVIGV